jgi:hypothetical protein
VVGGDIRGIPVLQVARVARVSAIKVNDQVNRDHRFIPEPQIIIEKDVIEASSRLNYRFVLLLTAPILNDGGRRVGDTKRYIFRDGLMPSRVTHPPLHTSIFHIAY